MMSPARCAQRPPRMSQPTLSLLPFTGLLAISGLLLWSACTHAQANAAEAAAVPQAAASRPGPKPAASPDERREAATRKALTAAVDRWAKAWSRRDSRAYLKAYAPGFISADRTMSHATWAEQRRQNLQDSHTIRIDIRELQWDARGSDWVGSFVETSLIVDRYRETRKQLLMRRIGERWLIIGEREDG